MRAYRLMRTLIVSAALAAAMAPATHAYHDTLAVFVNGRQLTPQEIRYAEQATGTRLRSGFYWYDERSGYWGLVNGPVLGRVSRTWAQGSTVTEAYSGGGGASRNGNVGIGVITDGSGNAVITR